jgi:hypothetical protein
MQDYMRATQQPQCRTGGRELRGAPKFGAPSEIGMTRREPPRSHVRQSPVADLFQSDTWLASTSALLDQAKSLLEPGSSSPGSSGLTAPSAAAPPARQLWGSNRRSRGCGPARCGMACRLPRSVLPIVCRRRRQLHLWRHPRRATRRGFSIALPDKAGNRTVRT